MSEVRDHLSFAGEVDIESVEYLKYGSSGIDITPQVAGITIYEDMFSPFITGELTLLDTLDLPNTFGRTGADLVYLNIRTPTVKVRLNGYFWVYKMSDRELVKDRIQTYKIHFASVEMMYDTTHPISRQFSGDCDEVVRSLIKSSFSTKKDIIADKSSNAITFVSNFWNASKGIRYVTDHTAGIAKTGSFLFYENRDGFNFRDIDTILKSEPIIEFDQSDYVIDINSRDVKATRNPEHDFKVIKGLRVDNTYDFLRDYMDGAIKNKLYTFDIITKTISTNTFDISRSRVNRANKNISWDPQAIAATEPNISFMNRGYGTFGLHDTSNHRIVQERSSLLRTLNGHKVEIDIAGRIDFTCGRMVSLNLNQVRAIAKNEKDGEYLDKILSGKYLVTAVAHRIKRDGHECTVELCKESTLSE